MTDKCFMLQCIFCKEKYDEKDLKRCGNYCSKECQSKDQSKHLTMACRYTIEPDANLYFRMHIGYKKTEEQNKIIVNELKMSDFDIHYINDVTKIDCHL